MKLLLDTHALLWSVIQPERLTPAAAHILEDMGNEALPFGGIRLGDLHKGKAWKAGARRKLRTQFLAGYPTSLPPSSFPSRPRQRSKPAVCREITATRSTAFSPRRR